MIEELREKHEKPGCEFRKTCYFYSKGKDFSGEAPVEGFPDICDVIEPAEKMGCSQYKKEINFWTQYHEIRKNIGK